MKQLITLFVSVTAAVFLTGCGSLRITSSPPGATVYVSHNFGGQFQQVGTTPYTESDAGDYCAAYVVWSDGTQSEVMKSLNILALDFFDLNWNFVYPSAVAVPAPAPPPPPPQQSSFWFFFFKR
jgi:hypothetical protein